MFVRKDTLRLILLNQMKIMDALSFIAAEPSKPCTASRYLLSAASRDTSQHIFAYYRSK